MSVPSYPFYSLTLKLPNKGMSFPLPPLKLPNKEREEYFKTIRPPPKRGFIVQLTPHNISNTNNHTLKPPFPIILTNYLKVLFLWGPKFEPLH